MRSRPLWSLFVVLFCSAFQSTGFQGCGGGTPPGGSLPPSGETGCFVDTDCVSTDMCRSVTCEAGACVDGGLLDADGDGAAPIPCGMDCDDFLGSRYPGAAEACDGVDQDCDGNIDEDAMPTPVSWYFSTLDRSPALAAFGDGLLIASTLSVGGVSLDRLTRLGSVTGISLVVHEGERIEQHELVTRASGATLFAVRPDAAMISVTDLTLPLTEGATLEIATAPSISDLAVTAYGTDQLAAVWIESGTDLRFWSSELAAPVTLLSLATLVGPLDIASDGSGVVVALPTATALFVDPVMGTTTAMRDIDSARTWAAQPLASGTGAVVALLRDAFDHAITRFDASSALGRQPAPAVMDRTMLGRIDAAGDRVIITRFSNGSVSIAGTTIAVLAADFSPIASFDPYGLGGPLGGIAYSWDVVGTPDFIALMTAYDGTVAGATLACGL